MLQKKALFLIRFSNQNDTEIDRVTKTNIKPDTWEIAATIALAKLQK